MEADKFDAVVGAVVRALVDSGKAKAREVAEPPKPGDGLVTASAASPVAASLAAATAMATATVAQAAMSRASGEVTIDLDDPARAEARMRPGVVRPANPDGLGALMECTSARIGVGRAGPRARTESLLLFQADHAITKDALMREVDPRLLEEFGFFSVDTRVEGGKEEYLRRPDLGRRLGEAATRVITERCAKRPGIQVCAGDGLSARAIEANLRKIFPVIKAGCTTAGLSFGTPFFVRNCRVGVMNDIGDILEPDVLILLIGERPGLGRADSMSAYMAFRPRSGQTDADRDVVCNIYDGGGTNPLEAGAYVLGLAQKMIGRGASGMKLRLMEG